MATETGEPYGCEQERRETVADGDAHARTPIEPTESAPASASEQPPRKQAPATPNERLWSALFVCLILMNLLSSSMAQMNTAGSPLLVERVGGSSAYGGFLVTVFVIASIPARMLSGWAADKFSRKAVLATGAVIYLAGALMASFIPTLAALLPARIFQGAGYATVHTAASTCASDILPQRRLGEGLGYYGLGHALAMAAGPMLGMGLVGTGSFAALAMGAAALSAVVLALSAAVTYEKHPEKLPTTSGYRQSREERAVQSRAIGESASETQMPVGAGTPSEKASKRRAAFKLSDAFEASALRGGVPMFLISGAIVFFLSFAIMFAKSEGYANPGSFFLFASAAAIAVRFGASKILDRLPPLLVFLVPLGAGALSLGGIFFVHLEWVFNLCGVGYGVCLGFAIPLLSSIAVKLAPPERWGAANALFFLCYDIGVGAGAVAWGALLDTFGFSAVFAASAASIVAALVSACALFPRKQA